MEVLHTHCAGLDLHKDSVVGCVRHMVDGKVRAEVKTFRTMTQKLMTLPDRLSAEDMSRFHTEGNLISWAGPSSKNDESAGKRRSRRMKKGARDEDHPHPVCMGGHAHHGTCLHAQCLRLRSRLATK